MSAVESDHLFEAADQRRGRHPESAQGGNRDRITHELELPQPLTVLAEARAFVFGPDVFMTHFVSDHRPQFFDTEHEEGPRGNQDYGPPVNADGCLWHIDDLDRVHRFAFSRLQ